MNLNGISMEDINLFSDYLGTFLIILLRTAIFVTLLPVIGGKELPPQFKIGFAVFIAAMLTPIVHFNIAETNLPMLIVKEIFIGIALGFTARFVFYAVNIAGAFISHAMGLSMGIVFNPEFGQTTFLSEIYGVIAMLIFIVTDAHHDLIYVFVKSFEVLPGGNINVIAVIPKILTMISRMFVIAVKLAAPVLVGLLIVHILPGFLYKLAPRLNIFFIVLPLNIFLGILLISMSIPVFEHVLEINFSSIKSEMARVVALAMGK